MLMPDPPFVKRPANIFQVKVLLRKFSLRKYRRYDGRMGSHYKGRANEVRALDAWLKLQRAAATVKARLEPELAEAELSDVQWGVLDALFHLGSLNQGTLLSKLTTSGGNLTKVVDHLEKRGLVERHRGKNDKRQIQVQLTTGGRVLFRGLLPGQVNAVTRQLAALTAAEQDELARLCKKLGTASPA
jgi:MarR family 2-MHQ and catechol resistance regulon transcriptional repressor